MKQVFEGPGPGSWVNHVEVELDVSAMTVVVTRAYRKADDPENRQPLGRAVHTFGSRSVAEKYFRYALDQQVRVWELKLVSGDEVALDPKEDFKDVKPKSADYRYLENAATGEFWDIDRDSQTLTMWRGAIGQRGASSEEFYDWDGPAKERYQALLELRLKEGFALAGESLSFSFADELQKEYGDVPKAYRKFLESSTFPKHNGKYIDELPLYQAEVKFEVFFDDSVILELGVWSEFDVKEHPHLLPIAKLGEEGGAFLALDRSDPKLPVVIYNHQADRVTDSFSAFKKRLFKRKRRA